MHAVVECCGSQVLECDDTITDLTSAPNPNLPCQHWGDGEAVQLKIINDPTMLKVWLELQLQQLKYCASCSGTEQALDVSPCFLALKRLLKFMTTKIADVDVAKLVEDFIAGLSELKKKFGFKMSGKDKDTLLPFLKGFPLIFTRYMVNNNIREGFRKSGQHPLSFTTMCEQCPGWRVSLFLVSLSVFSLSLSVCVCVCVFICVCVYIYIYVCVCRNCPRPTRRSASPV